MDHYPVMLPESIAELAIQPTGTYVEVTAGLGNHTRAIAERLTTGRLIATDRDAESLALARARCAEVASRIEFHQARFSEVPALLRRLGVPPVNGLFADLGVSRYQLTTPERGFSFQAEGDLDMRMSRQDELTAADIVNFWSERDLTRLFEELGERGPWRRVSRAIVEGRPWRTTTQLAKLASAILPRHSRIHPATVLFQSLRLRVNDEPEELDALLEWGPQWLAPGGRFVVIAFMSYDDRKVKVRFQQLARDGHAQLVHKKILTPSDQELRENAASRSARMRVIEMREPGQQPEGKRKWRN
jgi:16S rRNA (cytosine1402-N4)-methyltransferase